jgi:hypothetical protein
MGVQIILMGNILSKQNGRCINIIFCGNDRCFQNGWGIKHIECLAARWSLNEVVETNLGYFQKIQESYLRLFWFLQMK